MCPGAVARRARGLGFGARRAPLPGLRKDPGADWSMWGSSREVKVGFPGRAAGEALREEVPLGGLLHPLPAVQVTRENREW